jgi:hypothetical protein
MSSPPQTWADATNLKDYFSSRVIFEALMTTAATPPPNTTYGHIMPCRFPPPWSVDETVLKERTRAIL